MDTTERLFKKILESVEKRVKLELPHIRKESRKHIVKIVDEEARDRIAIGTLPPTNFPVGMIHQDDYYGLDNAELSKKLQVASLGCDWDI